jgi:tetratricopeptide (TPR) repeat protein
MMNIFDTVAESWWVPGMLRTRIYTVRLRPLLRANLKEADDILEAARQRRSQCVTKYARKRLGKQMADLAELRKKLVSSAERGNLSRLGRRPFDRFFRSLSSSAKALRETCETDAAYEQQAKESYEDRKRLAEEAAPLLTGIAESEFRRYQNRLDQRLSTLEPCRDLNEINKCFKDIQEYLAALERLVGKAKQATERLESAKTAYKSLDPNAISQDSRSIEIYLETTKLLDSIEQGLQIRDVERSLALLSKAHQNVQVLRQESDAIRSNAGIEVELWRYVVQICPRTTAAFAKELAAAPTDPAGQELADWITLKDLIETVVSSCAKETRKINGKALKNNVLAYELLNQDDRTLKKFAKMSYQRWQTGLKEMEEERTEKLQKPQDQP